jgi:hypothetical protein
MNIATAIGHYKEQANFFAPDYERENKVLRNFKNEHPRLSADDVNTLRGILLHDDGDSKFFVADLLYLYDDFDIELFEPLIESAITFNDPSFTWVFLRPCIRVFGVNHVSNILAEKFITSDPVRKIRISSLVYWLERTNNIEISNLEKAIVDRSKRTDNIIELYYYNRYFPDKVALDQEIPHNAEELINRIKGNVELEDFLFNKLGWQKMKDS